MLLITNENHPPHHANKGSYGEVRITSYTSRITVMNKVKFIWVKIICKLSLVGTINTLPMQAVL